MNNSHNYLFNPNSITQQQIDQQIESIYVNDVKKVFHTNVKTYGGVHTHLCKRNYEKQYLNNLSSVINSSSIVDQDDLEWMALNHD